MLRNLKKIFVSTLLFIVVGTLAQAQQMCSFNVCVQSVAYEQNKDTLQLRLSMDVSHAKVPLRQGLVLTPIFKSDKQQRALPPMLIVGKNRQKADSRKARFGNEISYPKPYITLKSGVKTDTAVPYIYTLKLEPWMKTASLELREQMHGCAGCTEQETIIPLSITETKGRPVPNYITPAAEAVKNRNMEGKAYLEFLAGESIIRADYRQNLSELRKILRAIDLLSNDDNTSITHITLAGYASPENSHELNQSLSRQRPQALKHYLQKEFSYPDNLFTVAAGGEDWQGLRKQVAASRLRDKQAVLNIIDNERNEDEREQKLRMLDRGTVFAELLQSYFPPLRRVDYTLRYTVRAFSLEECKVLIKTKPAQLSLNEMFLVANTYKKGSDEFNQVFDVAVRMFPDDATANVNAAAIALAKGDKQAAHKFLDALQSVPAAWNNLGVLYYLDGNEAKAKEFFEKAKAQGVEEATKNSALLQE
ncbi:MAG: DUF3868 domain-containing protein [Prevotellaceae bacterium]|jgi:outer membrane protein OmpA-like peptidoglycan-associated protein|nr:DUF3868 domain-containing protein [Prevotellaceae bacterium]